MSLTTPTTKEISDNIIAQLEATLNQTIPLLPKSFLRVLAKVLGAVFVLLYKYCGFIFLQIFVKTASISETTINGVVVSPLIAWGRLIGVGDPVAATNAEVEIDITVENQSGTLPAGSQLVGPSNGVTYLTLSEIALNSPTKTVTVRAASDQSGGGGAGTVGNVEIGAILSFANPIANVARETVVSSIVVTAADAESTEAYRQRVIDRFQKRPQGGAYADYEAWGEEVAGIINIYPYTSASPGQVDVYAEATEESSGSPDGIPTAAQLDAVAESIELDENGLASRRPAGAFVNTFPITRTGFDVEVSGLTVDNPASIQADITEALGEYFRDAEPFIFGLSIPPRRDRLTESAIIGLIEDIVTAANGTFTTALFNVAGLTPGDITEYVLQEGEKAKVVDVTYVP